jgi:hypothetical protein
MGLSWGGHLTNVLLMAFPAMYVAIIVFDWSVGRLWRYQMRNWFALAVVGILFFIFPIGYICRWYLRCFTAIRCFKRVICQHD